MLCCLLLLHRYNAMLPQTDYLMFHGFGWTPRISWGGVKINKPSVWTSFYEILLGGFKIYIDSAFKKRKITTGFFIPKHWLCDSFICIIDENHWRWLVDQNICQTLSEVVFFYGRCSHWDLQDGISETNDIWGLELWKPFCCDVYFMNIVIHKQGNWFDTNAIESEKEFYINSQSKFSITEVSTISEIVVRERLF